MKILAVDTALGACSAAVLDDAAVLAHRCVTMERGHAEALAPMVEEVMAEAGLAFSALDRLAVTTGPGTFTGQRVGLAFMRGLRVALKRPLVGVTTLKAMAVAAMAEAGTEAAAALHDAKRGEVYLEAVSGDGPLLEVQIQKLEAALETLRGVMAPDRPFALAGTAAELAAAQLPDCCRLTTIRQPDALWVARLGCLAPEPEGPPRPLYLRAPDAKLPARPAGR